MLYRNLLCIALMVITSLPGRASHIMGSHIGYKWLGGMDYEVTLVLIRDCFGIGLGGPQLVNATSSCGTLSFNLDAVDTVQVVSCSGFLSQCQGGTYPGAELHLYRDTVTLTTPCADWIFDWTSCCRNAAIINLVDPDMQDMYIWAQLDNLNHPGNSSPVWQELPGVAVCTGLGFCLPNGAFDIDGDSLVYSQVDPLGAQGAPLAFQAGSSATAPFPSSNGHAFDPVTGNHCTEPSTNGAYAMAYRVDEYRNGALVASSQREVQLWMINCPVAQMDIAGTVFDTLGNPVSSGEVQLFQYGLNSSGSILVNNATIGVGGTYSFPNQPVGQYLVRCISDTVNYPGTADSYHTSTYYWTYADVVASQCDSNVVADVTLVPASNLNGPGVLSGFLGDLGIVRSQVGAPWPGAAVILESWPATGLVAFTRTDNDGLWSLSGIPAGTYRIIVDHPGLPMRGHYIVTIGGGQNTYTDLDYTGQPDGIWPSAMLLGTSEIGAGAPALVFPNPSETGSITIDGLAIGTQPYHLVGSEGKVVRHFNLTGPLAALDVSGLVPGLYTLRSTLHPGVLGRIVVR